MDFTTKLSELVARVEQGLDQHLPNASTRPKRLHSAMRYSLEAGGKRLRPVLILAAAELFPPEQQRDAVPAAVAIECLHTYSLIHDDLPALDNDDLRRGRPTAHVAFDEATALLAGDALLTHAFSLLAVSYAADPPLANDLVRELSDAAGSRRLIGGQMEDVLAEKRNDVSAEDLEFIHLNKTAAMIEAALFIGGRVGGAAASELKALRQAGRALGLAFQIVDDVLDATADSATLGKTAGKDAQADKLTYVKLYGLETAQRLANEQSEAAVQAFTSLPGGAPFLTALTRSLTHRKR